METVKLPDIDEQALAELLRRYAKSVSPSRRLSECAEGSGYYLQLLNHECEDDGSRGQFVEALTKIPGLSEIADWQCRTSLSSGGRVTAVAGWLLAQLLGHSPEEVAHRLVEFIRENSCDLDDVQILWGLHPTEPVDLGQGIQLVPITMLKPHVIVDFALQRKLPANHPMSGGLYGSQLKPRAALVRSVRHGPIIAPSNYSPSPQPPQIELWEAAEALTLLGMGPIFRMFSYSCASVELPFVGAFGGMAGSASMWAHHFEIPKSDIGPEIERVRHYIALSEEKRAKFQIPIYALNVAQEMLRDGWAYNFGKAAVELGTAMEALLSNDRDNNDAISFKVRMRGAAWLGGSDVEKAHTLRFIKALYTLRSKVAHGGPIGTDGRGFRGRPEPVKVGLERMPANEFIRRAIDLVLKMLNGLLVDGDIPDWDCFLLTGKKHLPTGT